MLFLLYVIQYFTSADTTSFTTWEVIFKIADDGTNGEVNVTLVGKAASAHSVIICKNICDKNTESNFTFKTADIGSLVDIHLNVLNNDKWDLEEITIKNLNTSEVEQCKWQSASTLYYTCTLNIISSTTLQMTSPSVTDMSSTLIPTTITVEQTRLQTLATCYSGWVNIDGLCYRIVNRKEDVKNAKDSCENNKIVSTKIPDKLADMIGYDEIVWMNRSGNLQACRMKNLSICTTSGKYNSLCSREVINASLTLVGPMPFFNASWLIPNTKKSFDIIKQHFLNCCASKGIWLGMYKKERELYWTDGSLVSENEKNLLNIVNSPEKNCAMYNGSIIFIECSSTKMGLTIMFPPNDFNAVTSRMPSNSGHKSTSIPTTDRPNPVYHQSTTTARINMCPCPCRFPRKNISAEEFKEKLKEIVVNKKDTSSYKRSKICAPDERTSSKTIGMVAIVVIVIPFFLLILSDVPILVCQVIATYKRIIKGNP